MKIQHGDITTVTRGVIIQQVNAQGVMGSGVAKAIREKWPRVWETYSGIVQQYTQDRGLSYMGRVIVAEVGDELYVLNIVGQQFFGRDAKRYTSYDALDDGFSQIAAKTELSTPIHLPLIGSGLGGGSWSIIKAIIEKHLGAHDVTLWLQPGFSEPSK